MRIGIVKKNSKMQTKRRAAEYGVDSNFKFKKT